MKYGDDGDVVNEVYYKNSLKIVSANTGTLGIDVSYNPEYIHK